MIKKEKNNLKENILFNVIVLILGILISIVGLLMFYSNISGTRWMEAVKGARISGIMFILFGIYLIISSIKKIVIYKNEKRFDGYDKKEKLND